MRGGSRRAVLKGLLGGSVVTVALPPLESLLGRATSAQAAGGFPKRFGVFFWGNGNIPPLWNPAEEGTDWTPSPQLEPLASMKHKISVISGTDVKMTNRVPHGTGAAAVLSGAPLILRSATDYTFSAPTLDQLIARAVGGDTRFRSLELGVRPNRGGLSHNGPNSVNPPERDPARLFDRIFGGGFRAPGSEAPVDPKLRLRRSVLDAVLEQSRALQRRVGAADRARLEQHLTGVRELEARIARLEEDPPSLAACAAPAAPSGSFEAVDGRPQLSEISTAMIELTAMALACDQTRVFSFTFTDPVNDDLFGDAPAGHHQLTHDEPGDQPVVHGIVRFVMAELNRLLSRLDAVVEGDETLLDHSAILVTSDVSFGRGHSIEDFPILVAGGACGALKAGQHIRALGENTSKVGLSLLRAMGVPSASFGEAEGRVTSGIAGLET